MANNTLVASHISLVQIVTNWGCSGNGFGQRTAVDAQCGRVSEEHIADGDNRGSFTQSHLGHCIHHLHLWHRSDKMGALHQVLNVLATEVGADASSATADTARVQRKRVQAALEDGEDVKKF